MGKRDIELTSYRRRLHRTPRRPRSIAAASSQHAIRRRTDNWSTQRIRRRIGQLTGEFVDRQTIVQLTGEFHHGRRRPYYY